MRALLSIAVAAVLSWIAIVRTENFSPSAIRGPAIFQEGFVCGEEIQRKLAMPYRYLASGRQSYVFVSEDGTTVLKFFRKSYYSIPWYISFLPWKEQEIAKRQKRREFYLQSYRIAAKEFRQETGLLFFGRGKNLPRVHVFDKAHRWHEIDLNEVPFVLQKRGEPFSSSLALLPREVLERALDRFLLQIAQRIEKKVADADQDVEHNFGWVEGTVFHLDPGRLFYDEALKTSKRRQEEWWSATHRFRKWLSREVPEIIPFFDARLRWFEEERSPLDLLSEETICRTGRLP